MSGSDEKLAASNSVDDVTRESSSEIRQVVCFKIRNEVFGVDIARVQEIIRIPDITRIPHAPEFIKGAINLRGKIVPVIDLRKRFGFPEMKEVSRDRRIVVLDIRSNAIGVIVDQVNRVLRLPEESISPTPDLARSDVADEFMDGVATVDEDLLILLEPDRIFTREETDNFRELSLRGMTE